MTARATRTQTRPESDEEANNRGLRPGHVDIRRRRRKEKRQHGWGDEESEQEGPAPSEFVTTGGQRSVEDATHAQGASGEEDERCSRQPDGDAADQGSPGSEMRPVDLHGASMSLQRKRTTIKTRSFAECSVRAKAVEGYFLGNRRCPSCSWAAGTLNWHTAVRRLLSRCLKSMKRSLGAFLSASQPAVARVVRAHVASRIALGWSFAGRQGEIPLTTEAVSKLRS